MVGFVVTGPTRDSSSKQPWTLSYKYKKSLSPLGKVCHSTIGVFFSLPRSCSKLPLQLLYFELVFSSSMFGFKLGGWLPILHHL